MKIYNKKYWQNHNILYRHTRCNHNIFHSRCNGFLKEIASLIRVFQVLNFVTLHIAFHWRHFFKPSANITLHLATSGLFKVQVTYDKIYIIVNYKIFLLVNLDYLKKLSRSIQVTSYVLYQTCYIKVNTYILFN